MLKANIPESKLCYNLSEFPCCIFSYRLFISYIDIITIPNCARFHKCVHIYTQTRMAHINIRSYVKYLFRAAVKKS